MRDVSRTAFTAVLDAAERMGLDGGPLRRLREEVSSAGSWVDWSCWVDFLDRVGAESQIRDHGGLRALGQLFPDVSSLAFLRKILTFVASPELMYLAAGRWFGQSLFPDVKCETSELGDGRLRQTLRLPDHWRESTGFFDLMWGALIAGPRLISLGDSHVEVERSSHSASFVIVPPPAMSWVGRSARAVRMLLTGADHEVIKLFSHMVERLQEGNRDVEAQWLRAEARNEALTEALEENRRMAEALAKAREELEFRIQEQDGGDALMGRLRWLARGEPGRQLLTRIADFIDAADASDL